MPSIPSDCQFKRFPVTSEINYPEFSNIMADTAGTALVLVDVSSIESYEEEHIRGALHVDYEELNAGTPPAAGLLPPIEQLGRIADRLGLAPDASRPHVVAYDAEGGGRSARLLWTLDVLGYSHWSWLNGGLEHWVAAGGSIEAGKANRAVTEQRRSGDDTAKDWRISSQARATLDDVRNELGKENVCLLDCRSEAEYLGKDVRAARGGRIPGAVLSDWMDTISMKNHPALHDLEHLKEMFLQRGVQPESDVIVYCQTHHRSSHTYVILKALGYNNLRGYDGSWSEWGNVDDTPVET